MYNFYKLFNKHFCQITEFKILVEYFQFLQKNLVIDILYSFSTFYKIHFKWLQNFAIFEGDNVYR